MIGGVADNRHGFSDAWFGLGSVLTKFFVSRPWAFNLGCRYEISQVDIFSTAATESDLFQNNTNTDVLQTRWMPAENGIQVICCNKCQAELKRPPSLKIHCLQSVTTILETDSLPWSNCMHRNLRIWSCWGLHPSKSSLSTRVCVPGEECSSRAMASKIGW